VVDVVIAPPAFFSAERQDMEFHNVYSSPKVINGQIKEVDMGGTHVACIGAVKMRREETTWEA
jgi:hypothetical protein